jgi:hypothetical protein
MVTTHTDGHHIGVYGQGWLFGGTPLQMPVQRPVRGGHDTTEQASACSKG